MNNNNSLSIIIGSLLLLSLVSTPASAAAAPLGAATVHRMPPHMVRRIFGVFLVLVGLRMLAGF